eukprot:CAMPEP_0119415950 /NCGR_PEP_ID=MMETSP1335-20130426/11036_1 /TAXON_ID=259385 /ORGANISM="Chrysoculter rhomboideus, Strain RCC1486" /LENGTH=170 /DNA_ID=CAMNT_0007441011 /DNA_START=23 /DNA_END=535 /DNA_ORIENTATION=-
MGVALAPKPVAAFARPSPAARITTSRRMPTLSLGPVRPSGLPAIVAAESEEEGGAELGLYGVVGTFASIVCFVSEFTLKTTGCGLPAGPFGLYGAVEGVSYLAIVGIIGASLFTKLKTGRGLPNGPFGLLGLAEGLAYLAAVAGIVVAGLTVVDFGDLPNAVPIEGGRCS